MEKDRKGAQAKGDAKKAAGKMTGEANLEAEGKADKAAAGCRAPSRLEGYASP